MERIQEQYNFIRALYNAEQFELEAQRDRGTEGALRVTIGSFENLTSWYSLLEERMRRELSRTQRLEAERVLEDWMITRPFKGNPELKFDVFFVNQFYAEYPALVESMANLWEPVRKELLDPENQGHQVSTVAILSCMEQSATIGPDTLKASQNVVEALFGVSSSMWSTELVRDEFRTPTEGLLTFLFAESATLPMLAKPDDYFLPTEYAGAPIDPSIHNASPYFKLSAKPVHASYSVIESVITELGQDAMNKAQSVEFIISDNAAWVGNPNMVRYETERFGNMERLDQVQHSFSLMRAYSERAFFCPTFIDYRGRMYYYGGFLQPQTINMVRAHIEANVTTEVPREAWAFLMLFMMNEVGAKGTVIDKLMDSLTWFEQAGQAQYLMDEDFSAPPSETSFEYVQNVAEVALELEIDTSGFWSLLQVVRLLQLGVKSESLKSGLIIYSDASQSGSQIISLLTNDSELQNAVNINAETDLSAPVNDYYLSIVEDIQENWRDDLSSKGETMRKLGNAYTRTRGEDIQEDEVEALVKRVERKYVKRNVMTMAYNITLFGAGEQLIEDLGDEITPREAGILAVLIRSSVERVFPRLDNFLKVCADSVKARVDGGLSIQLVNSFVGSIVNIRRRKPVTVGKNEVVVETDKADMSKLVRSHAPNVIHSIDGSIVHFSQILASFTVDRLGNEMPLVTIHDSFGTTPAFVFYLPMLQRMATLIALITLKSKENELIPTMLPAAPSEYINNLGLSQDKIYVNILTSTSNYDLPVLTREECGKVFDVVNEGWKIDQSEGDPDWFDKSATIINDLGSKDRRLAILRMYVEYTEQMLPQANAKYPPIGREESWMVRMLMYVRNLVLYVASQDGLDLFPEDDEDSGSGPGPPDD